MHGCGEFQSLVALKQAVSPLTFEAVDEAIRKIKAETASTTKSLQAVIKEFVIAAALFKVFSPQATSLCRL